MSKRRLDKKIMLLEPVFKDILVCKSKDFRPYIEIFIEEPENVFQQNLGTLFGILEINEESEDSSYIVNYLISVIKKEYFSNTKRGPVESFEAALHKANLALTKLAQHNNIGWLGNLNVVCAVSEKNNIHLSQTGTASAFLVRSRSIASVIENDPTANEELNPLKTFQEVVSGRMEDQDKLILTTDSIFDIFSLEEIKKSAIKFSREEFNRFLNTALINELEKAAVLIVDIQEKEESQEAEPARKTRKINAFSQETFARQPENNAPRQQEERKELVEELKKELEKTQNGFVDEKTGHIYIKDEEYPIARPVKENYIRNVYEKLSASGSNLATTVKEKTKSQISTLSAPRSGVNLTGLKDRLTKIKETARKREIIVKPKIEWQIIPKTKLFFVFLGKKLSAFFSASAFYAKSFLINRAIPAAKKIALWISIAFSAIFHLAVDYFSRLRSLKLPKKTESERIEIEVKEVKQDYSTNPEAMASTREEKREWFNKLSGRRDDFSSIASQSIPQAVYTSRHIPIPKGNFLPSFSRLKNLLSEMDGRKKTMAFSAIALLILGPYLAIKMLDKTDKKSTTVATVSPEPQAIFPLQDDKNVVRVASMNSISSDIRSSKLIDVNGKLWAVDKNNIYFPEENASYPLPDDFQNPELVFQMDDLNLIHIEKEGRVLSFSVSAKKFQNNKISLPDTHSLSAGGSYLTYAYFLDSQANQVYRYPRADGGFGEKTDWLKDTVDLKGYKAMAINGDVFLTDGKNILKFTKGKKQDFSLESAATPIYIDEIYTKPDKENIYILDKANSRILKIGSAGNILSDYYHDDIKNSQDFVVDEETQKAFISTDKGIESFSI